MNEQMFKNVKVFNTDFFEEGKAYFISHTEGLEIDGLLIHAYTDTLTFIVIDTDKTNPKETCILEIDINEVLNNEYTITPLVPPNEVGEISPVDMIKKTLQGGVSNVY